MSYTILNITNGRIGNQLIRNILVSFIAEKQDLYVEYSNNDFFKELGINLYCGKNKFEKTQKLTNCNYFLFFKSKDKLLTNIDANYSFFQTKKFSKMIYKYLNTDNIKNNIIEKNNFKDRYNNNNDIFVHVRLDDGEKFNPGINYYITAIENINNIDKIDNIYISTDDPSHQIIKELLQKYSSAKLFIHNELTTFQFASTCKNIILSLGTFSISIGYLAFFSNIHYPKININKIIEQYYCGDIFPPTDKWIEVDY